MLRQTSLLVSLVLLIDRLSWPFEPIKRPQGRPKTYLTTSSCRPWPP
jgi:hypothetical protein